MMKLLHAGRHWAINRRAVELQLHVTSGVQIGQTDQMLRRLGFRQTGRELRVGTAEGGAFMKAHAVRNRLVGWMRPSVGKVGAVQVGTGVIAVGALFTGVSWPWWVLALLGYFFYACVGHSVGYHRYFAHRSFRAPRWAEVMFTVAGTLGCVGSPVGWAQMHHRHHRYSDREDDPYTAHRYPYPTPGALLMGGYGTQRGSARALRRMFRADPLQVFVMRYYFGVVAAFSGTLLLVDWRWFVFGWAVPVAWTLWMAGLDAWATHRHGYRNHDTPDGSRNLWWCSLLSWGEGWHNNHHANPRAWSYRETWWEWDPGAAVVWVILRLSSWDGPPPPASNRSGGVHTMSLKNWSLYESRGDSPGEWYGFLRKG